MLRLSAWKPEHFGSQKSNQNVNIFSVRAKNTRVFQGPRQVIWSPTFFCETCVFFACLLVMAPIHTHRKIKSNRTKKDLPVRSRYNPERSDKLIARFSGNYNTLLNGWIIWGIRGVGIWKLQGQRQCEETCTCKDLNCSLEYVWLELKILPPPKKLNPGLRYFCFSPRTPTSNVGVTFFLVLPGRLAVRTILIVGSQGPETEPGLSFLECWTIESAIKIALWCLYWHDIMSIPLRWHDIM